MFSKVLEVDDKSSISLTELPNNTAAVVGFAHSDDEKVFGTTTVFRRKALVKLRDLINDYLKDTNA